jgi:hypothetical protein
VKSGDSIRFEDGKYGRRVILCSPWSYSMRHKLRDVDFVELELNQARGWTGNDVFFVKDFPFLLSIDILDLRIQDIGPIHYLHALKRLGVTTYCSTEIRFSEFPELEDCALEWRPLANSLFDCRGLKRLFINRYDAKSTDSFSGLANLESLAILNAPIESLRGLRPLAKLRFLRLGGSPHWMVYRNW